MSDASAVDGLERVGSACGCPRHAAMKPLLTLIAWLAAAISSLFVVEIPYEPEHSVCGVWGCYPPVQALVAMHLFWSVMFGMGIWIVWTWLPRWLPAVGAVLGLVAAGILGWVVGSDLQWWFHRIPAEAYGLWPRRVVYTVATMTDWPMVEGVLAGVVGVVLGGRGGSGRGER